MADVRRVRHEGGGRVLTISVLVDRLPEMKRLFTLMYRALYVNLPEAVFADRAEANEVRNHFGLMRHINSLIDEYIH